MVAIALLAQDYLERQIQAVAAAVVWSIMVLTQQVAMAVQALSVFVMQILIL
jgi:hypothetical protein